MAIVGGLVLARGPQRSATLEMRQAAGLVAGTLRVARSRAIASNRPVPVRFDPGAATLQIGGLPPRSLPPGVALAVTGAEAGQVIIFRPDGSSSGGAVQLGVAGRRAAIDVSWLTGRVAVAEAQ